MFYLLLAVVFVFVSGYLFKKGAGSISIYHISMMSWIFYYDFVIYSVIGAVLVVNNVDNFYLLDKLFYDSSRIKGFYAILYTIIAFPLGMLLANFVFRIKKMRLLFGNYITKPIEKEHKYNDHNVRIMLIITSLACVISVMYVLFVLGDIPLLRLLMGGNPVEFAVTRIDVTRNFQGNEYVKNILAIGFTPFLSYVAYGYKKLINTWSNRLWFYVMFVFSVLIITYNFEKGPILFYLLGFVLFRVYLKGGISKKIIIRTFLILLFLIIGLIAMLSGEGIDVMSLFSYNSGIVGRVFLAQGAGTFLSFDLFPSTINHIGFSSISGFLSEMFNIEHCERSARFIMEQINPKGILSGEAGVVNSLFIAEAWANFGIIGLVIAPLYVGFLIQCFYLFLLKSPKTPSFLALLVLFTTKGGITGGFNDYMYNINMFCFLCLLVLIYGGAYLVTKYRYY